MGLKVILLRSSRSPAQQHAGRGGNERGGDEVQARRDQGHVDQMIQDTMKGAGPERPRVVKVWRQLAAAVDRLTSIGADISDVGRWRAPARPGAQADRGATVGPTSPACEEERCAAKDGTSGSTAKWYGSSRTGGRVTGVVVEGNTGHTPSRQGRVVTTGASPHPKKVGQYRLSTRI
jgi:hypothetical protein